MISVPACTSRSLLVANTPTYDIMEVEDMDGQMTGQEVQVHQIKLDD